MRRSEWMRLLVLGGMATTTFACAVSTPGDDAVGSDELPTLVDDLVAPEAKDDTGYFSNLATEVEGVLSAQLFIDVVELEESERAARLDDLVKNNYELQRRADKQIKFMKNEIKAEELHSINLSTSKVEVVGSRLDNENDRIVIDYRTVIETIVTAEQLRESGGTIENLFGRQFSAQLPSDPSKMAAEVGAACLSEGHDEAEDYNYFYYYEPAKEGCSGAMDRAKTPQIRGTLELKSLAPTKRVYPEYDQLVADKKVEVVVFFGAADYDWEPGKWDWGVSQRDTFVRHLAARGFEKRAAEHGDLYAKRVGDLDELITVIGPETLKMLKDDADGLFQRVVRANEVVMYNGHSFYGSLDVLDDPAVFPGTYQIFFMNSCWSYEYYTKQIFNHNTTEADPEGWLAADVVNDTESGWFHNMADETRILLTNLLRGAETGGEEGARKYHWEAIIEAMNRHAVDTQERRGTKTHEIYGVSGVRTNRYVPGAAASHGANLKIGSSDEIVIPDNDAQGVSSILVAQERGEIASMTISIDVDHSYQGDLRIELRHGSQSVLVFDGRQSNEPSRDHVVLDGRALSEFQGKEVSGEWELVVVDQQAWDEGTIKSWSLDISLH